MTSWQVPHDYVCLGAQIAQRHGLLFEEGFRVSLPVGQLADSLQRYLSWYDRENPRFSSLLVRFQEAAPEDPERSLWLVLDALRDSDPTLQPQVPADAPSDFHFAGIPIFPVLLHPQASRPARRLNSGWGIAFNPKPMFDCLKQSGVYSRFVSTIRRRDLSASPEAAMQFHAAQRLGLGDAPEYAGEPFDRTWRRPDGPQQQPTCSR